VEVIKINGRTAYIERRAGAEMVVLVRLASRDGGIWDRLWRILAEHYTVLNVDLGSPGGIETEPDRVLSDFADVIVEAAAAVDPRPFHLVGWTGGTQIGLLAAARHRQSLSSMTLITPFREAGDMRQVEVGLDLIEALLSTDRWDLYTRFWFMAGLSDTWIQCNFDAIEDLVAQRLKGDPFVAMDIARAMHWMRALRRNWVSDQDLAAFDLPTLVVGAGQNRWHAGPSREMAEALHLAIPGSTLCMFDNFGPLLLIEDPEAVGEEVLRFLACQGA